MNAWEVGSGARAGLPPTEAAVALLQGLNPAQAAAVVAPDGPLLVLAGAGSGKTRVLTHRIAYLVASNRAEPSRIFAVTFTNKAAREMRSRLEQLLARELTGMWLGTFHACSARLLRERGHLVGVSRDFVIYDEVDRQALLRESMKAAGIDEKRLSTGSVAAEISRAKNELFGPEEYSRSARGYVETQVASVYPRYQQMLTDAGALDFDDLLLRAVELLTNSQEGSDYYRRRFDHLLVDEYQDTNRAQYLMLRSLATVHRRLTVVGDPDQSVYSWRGADLRNIMEFQKDYPEATVVALEQNYRSTKAILKAAQAVIVENLERVEKALWTDGPDGAPVQIAQLYDEREEATAVAREAGRLVEQGEATWSEIAVLYRTNAQSRALEEVLLRAGIPYRLVGGVRFYQRREVKDVLAYLRLLAVPTDRVAFERVVNQPKRGIGAQSLSTLYEAARRAGRSHWDELLDPRAAGVRGAAASSLARFRTTVEELAAWARPWPLVRVIDRVLEQTGYERALRDGSPEGEERWANVLEVRGLAAEFGDQPSQETLHLFLEQVALAGEGDQLEEGARAMTLITLHQVKGLEFPVVFITGVEEGLLPHSRSLDTLSELEEERRLLYVGMTRARHRLYLSHCFRRHVYGSPTAAIPSRFLQPLAQGGEAQRWAEGASPSHAGSVPDGPGGYALPASALGQPAPLRRARDFIFERATAPAPAAPLERRFQAGDRVEHARFGRGRIRSSEMSSAGEEVVIDFDSAGVRRFAVSDAVLRKVG